MLRTVRATRYVTPLREGGSLPAIVEADDLGLYVLKFRGAGQGTLALVSELIAGEIGRVLGLKIPELVLVEVDAALGRNEPDAEIRHLLQASIGLNLALDYLPGSTMFNPAAKDRADSSVASEAVWFDAFVTNVDRTVKNPNLLYWHKTLYLIDHGAALYFHHNWPADSQGLEKAAESAFAPIRQHVLLRWANAIEKAADNARAHLIRHNFVEILEAVPDDWLLPESAAATPALKRAGYVDYFTRRLNASDNFVQEALRARAELV
jgi:hypothetical protein